MSHGVELDVLWRAPTPADAAAWAEFMAAVEAVDRDGEVWTAEDFVEQLADPDVDPDHDGLLGFDTGGRLVAFGWVTTPSGARREHAVSLQGHVHPDVRGRGLGRELLARLEARGRARAAQFDDALPALLRVEADVRHEDRLRLFERAGYRPSRHWFQMRRDLSAPLPDIALPAGIEVTGWREELDEATRLAHNAAFADHWGSEPRSPERWRHGVTGSRGFRPDLSRVALAGGEVVGYALCGHWPEDAAANGFTEGWILMVGVDAARRRRGLGAALISASMVAMRADGLDYAALGVDTENVTGALGLYERLGFATYQQTTTFAKPLR